MMRCLIFVAVTFLLVCSAFAEHKGSDNDGEIINSIFTSIAASPKKDQFKAFHYLYNRSYDLNSEEGIKRYRIFKDNVKLIEKSNAENTEFQLGINQFADITMEEYKNTYLSKVVEEPQTASKEFDLIADDDDDDDDEHDNVDWSMYIPIARNQYQCGSCWAFAAVSTVEIGLNQKFGLKLDLSQQHVVDCDTVNKACDGGSPPSVFDFLVNNGLTYANSYIYTSGFTQERGVCKQNIQTIAFVKAVETGKFSQLIKKGPVQASIDGNSHQFAFYKSGIINLTGCTEKNHSVVAIGYLYIVEIKKQIVKIFNSYGHRWGENGTMRIAEYGNTCFTQAGNILPILRNIDNLPPVPSPPVEGCMKVYERCTGQGLMVETCETKTSLFPGSISGQFSVQFGKLRDTAIQFFKGEFCTNGKLELYDSESCLGMKVESVFVDTKVRPSKNTCVLVYEDPCMTGKVHELCDKVTEITFKVGSIVKGSQIKIVRIDTPVFMRYLYDEMTYNPGKDFVHEINKISLEFY